MNAYMTNYGLYRLMILVGPDGAVLAVNNVDPTGKPLDTSGIYEMNFAAATWFKKAVPASSFTARTASPARSSSSLRTILSSPVSTRTTVTP